MRRRHILIGNLLDNALRYTPPQGRVEVWLGRVAGRLVLKISDTGPGISVAERERVFSRFYRTVGETPPGSRLGLAIAQEIAQQHSAKLTLEDPEKGTSGLTVQLLFEG